MVGSRIAPQGEAIIRSRIRIALAAALLVAAACSGGSSPPKASARPSASASSAARASPSPPFPRSVWVLTPLGLNVRADSSLTAARVATVPQGAELVVKDSRTVATETWLSVHSADAGADGWVLDRSDLVIHLAVSLHIDTAQGYSLLFPKNWDLKAGNPTIITGPPTDPDGGQLIVQQAKELSQLQSVPTQPGRELRQEGPLEVYGVTTFATIYRLDTGSFEFATAVKSPPPTTPRAYLFLYKQSARSEPDPSLYKQLLAGVAFAG